MNKKFSEMTWEEQNKEFWPLVRQKEKEWENNNPYECLSEKEYFAKLDSNKKAHDEVYHSNYNWKNLDHLERGFQYHFSDTYFWDRVYKSTYWRYLLYEVMKENNDSWDNIEYSSVDIKEYDTLVHYYEYGETPNNEYTLIHKIGFTLWTKNWIYVATEYDSSLDVAKIPRNPSNISTFIINGCNSTND